MLFKSYIYMDTRSTVLHLLLAFSQVRVLEEYLRAQFGHFRTYYILRLSALIYTPHLFSVSLFM